jgi:rfaE bifunctional protein kinase chain/domain
MIQELLDKAPKLKIAIIGDVIIDKYIIGDVERISPEAPVPVLIQQSSYYKFGGAGNVYCNLKNLGVDTYIFTTGEYNFLADDFFIHPGKTPIKTRIMSGNHHLLRIDEEDSPSYVQYDDVAWRHDFETLLPSLDCVIFSDYHKGSIDITTAQTIINSCNEKGIPVIVDAKKDFHKYKYATIVKCNNKEASNISVIRCREDFIINYFIVTLGSSGISLHSSKGQDVFLGHKVNIIDVCGAGDTVTAIIAFAFSCGLNIMEATELANKAAAEVCKHAGVYAITKEDLLKL